MTSNYHELLARAHSQLPHDILAHPRFEIPRVKSGTIGMRTYIVNYKEIADALRRDPLHMLRYFSREMATAGSLPPFCGDGTAFRTLAIRTEPT